MTEKMSAEELSNALSILAFPTICTEPIKAANRKVRKKIERHIAALESDLATSEAARGKAEEALRRSKCECITSYQGKYDCAKHRYFATQKKGNDGNA